MAALNLRLFIHKPLPEALDVVRSVITANPRPLKTKELYGLALAQPDVPSVKHILRPKKADPKLMALPPHPTHPIRSLSYLRDIVLPALEKENFIKKIHTTRPLAPEEFATIKDTLAKSTRKLASEGTLHEWLWERKGDMPIQKPRPAQVVDTKQIVYSQDISHLNKRRQRTRRETFARELEWVNELEKAKKEGEAAARAKAKKAAKRAAKMLAQ